MQPLFAPAVTAQAVFPFRVSSPCTQVFLCDRVYPQQFREPKQESESGNTAHSETNSTYFSPNQGMRQLGKSQVFQLLEAGYLSVYILNQYRSKVAFLLLTLRAYKKCTIKVKEKQFTRRLCSIPK